MFYRRMPIEVESPEQMGYHTIKNNLSESSYTDALLGALDIESYGQTELGKLILCYGDHVGHEGLRELIAKEANLSKSEAPAIGGPGGAPQTPLSKNDVLLTIGAAGALFIIATSLLEKGDELLVVSPNYATNLETPGAIGAAIRTIDLKFEENFVLDPEQVQSLITPKTKYISVTYPHNPTGACLPEGQLGKLIGIAEKAGIPLLVDETYRDMVFGELPPLAAALSPAVISVSSLSKTFGLPGLRTGWIVTQDRKLMERFLAAKEQIHICGPVLEEEIAFRYYQQKDRYLGEIRKDIRKKFELVKDWMCQQNDFEWVEPQGGAVCFPRMTDPGGIDIPRFYKLLLEKYSTYVGPGHWFEMPGHYMRVGYGWPIEQALQEGLESLTKCIGESRKSS